MFRVKIVELQENYMNKLNHKLAKLLIDEKVSAAERFWKAEKIINREKKSAGVIIQMSRSMLKLNLLKLLKEKAITLEDLSDFSPELQEEIKKIWEMFLDFEIEHLKIAARIFEKQEKRDEEEVIGTDIIIPCRFQSQKNYVKKVLMSEIQKRVTGNNDYANIKDLPEDWASYKIQQKANEEGSPTENIIQIITAAKGRDLVIADEELKNNQAKLLEKGLEKVQAPNTVSVEKTKAIMKEKEIIHEC